MKKLIIFDCDGVLLDSEWLACSISAKYITEIGYNISTDEYLDAYMGKTSTFILKDLEDKGVDMEKYAKKPFKLDNPEFVNNLKAIYYSKELLENLKCEYCIGSSSSMLRLRTTLEMTGLLSYFEGKIFSAETVGKSKPAPDVFLYAAEKMGYQPKDCIVIEDSIYGVQAAKSAKMDVYGFTGATHMNDNRSQKLIDEGVIRNFSTMQELENFISQLS